MKKVYHIILIFFIFSIMCSSCSVRKELPESVTIEKHTYRRAFVAELYPLDDPSSTPDYVRVSGVSYYRCANDTFDCYVAYDNNAEPNVYFAESVFDEAVQYYKKSDNYLHYCVFGNIHDETESETNQISEIDGNMFDALLDFAQEHQYNPLTSFNHVDGLRHIPIADYADWVKEEIHLYKESKDGHFSTTKAYTFLNIEDSLVYLHIYYADKENLKMAVFDVPQELSDYFIPIVEDLKENHDNGSWQ
jgi:hypothetical protein